MTKYIPVHRFFEIRNLVESIVFRAAYCVIGRHAYVAETNLLKPNSHIRLLIDPTQDPGTAKYTINKIPGTKEPFRRDTFQICIFFNGNTSKKSDANEIYSALIKVLGEIIFFSEASLYYGNVNDFTEDMEENDKNEFLNEKQLLESLGSDRQKEFLEEFVKKSKERRPFNLDAIRPRFSLAKLIDIIHMELRGKSTDKQGKIVDENQDSKRNIFLKHSIEPQDVQKLLWPYLGPGGWKTMEEENT